MIVPMKKIQLLVLSEDKQENLEQLQQLGCIHVQIKPISGENTEKQVALFNLKKAIQQLASYKKPLKAFKKKTFSSDPLELAQSINNEFDRLQTYQQQLEQCQKTIDQRLLWKIADPKKLLLLEQSHYHGQFFSCAKSEYKNLKIPHILVYKNKASIGFFTINDQKVSLPAVYIPYLPDDSNLTDLQEQKKQWQLKIQEIKQLLDLQLESYYYLQSYVSEFEDQAQLSRVSNDSYTYSNISCIEGYIPSQLCSKLKTWAKSQGLGVVISHVQMEDKDVPTLLKLPRIFHFILPVYKFLGTYPGYYEIDISFVFSIFLTLFFALLISDAGYGFLFLTIALIWRIIRAKKHEPFIAMEALIYVFSGATIVWGALTGSWFFSQAIVENTFLIHLVIPWFYLFDKNTSEHMKYFCLFIGFIHLAIAHLWQCVRALKYRKIWLSFSQLGSILMLWGFLQLAFYFVVSPEKYPLNNADLYFILIGFGVYFLLCKQDNCSFGKGILRSLIDSLQIFLVTISNFSDTVSYIRLFAVALASSSIALTFNGMAASIAHSPGGWIAAIALLIVAHGINIALGMLAILVHGIRLNLLEFSGHIGLEWQGHVYEPFAKKTKKIFNKAKQA